MHPQIQIQEPFKKTWSEPQVIVTQEDILNYENSLEDKCAHHREIIDSSKSEANQISPIRQDHNSHIATETLKDRLLELRNSLLQSQLVQRQLFTPTKQFDRTYNTNDSDLAFRPSVSSAYSQNCNQNTSQHSMSRSLPPSPVCGESPIMMSSPKLLSATDRHFSFVSERLRFLEESRELPKSDEVDNGFRLTQGYFNSPQGSSGCASALYESTGSRRTVDKLFYEPNIQTTHTPYMRAKRKLNLDDDPYNTPIKRAKSDVSQDAGQRYIHQLEMDLLALKHKTHSASPATAARHTLCACSEMEKQFMEMATSACKSIRRYDGTIERFEQFREELAQTNKVIKDSMELLQNVRRLCAHWLTD